MKMPLVFKIAIRIIDFHKYKYEKNTCIFTAYTGTKAINKYFQSILSFRSEKLLTIAFESFSFGSIFCIDFWMKLNRLKFLFQNVINKKLNVRIKNCCILKILHLDT